MNAYQALRRLRAFQKGRPLPRGETIHFPIAKPEDILVLCFVRMGGESGPWGMAFGPPSRKPTVLVAPEPRNRDMVADMAAEFAPILLGHFLHPKFCEIKISGAEEKRPLRQVWLPNATHLEMLHLLEFAYSRTRFGNEKRAGLLRAFGRLCGWLFRESQRPGQVTALVAADALRESFAFPAEDVRQAHLGFLLAWLDARGGREARMEAAGKAELKSIATSLDPAFERDDLQDRVEEFNAARTEKRKKDLDHLAEAIRSAVKPDLMHRFGLVERTIELLREDRRQANLGLDKLIAASQSEHWYQYLRLEYGIDDGEDGPAFTPSPETDRHPAAASSRYYVHESSAELLADLLLHDDKELQAEAVAAGEAIQGEIVSVSDEGEGKKSRPVWEIETLTDLPLRLREGAQLCVVRLARRTGRIRSFHGTAAGRTRFGIEIMGLKTDRGRDLPVGTLPANSPKLLGSVVTLVKTSGHGISRRKSAKVWAKDLPGSWLTLRPSRGPNSELPQEVAEDIDSIQNKLGVQ